MGNKATTQKTTNVIDDEVKKIINFKTKQPWMKLLPLTSAGSCSKPIFFNDNEVIMASCGHMYGSSFSLIPGIWKYNFNTKMYSLLIPYTDYIKHNIDDSRIMAYSKLKKTIFVYRRGVVFIFDIHDLNNVKIEKFITDISMRHDYHPEIICINGKFHLFGGISDINECKHEIWDESCNTLQSIENFNDTIVLPSIGDSAQLHYIRSRNSVLIICGRLPSSTYLPIAGRTVTFIYELCLKTNKWSKLKIHFVTEYRINSIVTTDERYLIIIESCIWVIDLNTMKRYECDIKGPNTSIGYGPQFYAVICNDSIKSDFLVCRYFRDCFNGDDILTEIKNIIVKKYCDHEYIYLFQKQYILSPRYGILVTDILLSRGSEWR